MSERILKALMQLFAIIAKVDIDEETGEIQLESKGRQIVRTFLSQELNQELVEEYLEVFDEYVIGHHTSKRKRKTNTTRKRTSVNSVKVLRICTSINEELAQRQKIIVFIRILEFTNANDVIAEQELEFVTTVAETFNIVRHEFDQCLEFVKAEEGDFIDNENYLVVDSNDDSRFESSKHLYSETMLGFARVFRVQSINTYFVKYYGSHQLSINGQLLTQDRVHILTQGSSLRSSKVQPVYYSDIISRFLSDTASQKIVFKVDKMQYHFKGGKIGLHNIDFTEESGKLIGIMGGSGAGKSTLLNVLNGGYTPTIGKVTINGIDLHHEKEKLQGVIGFVPQDDLLIEELTVFQNLFYNAKLCFGNLGDVEIVKLVVKTLKSIGLYEAKDLKVGNPLEKTISGGQRKRLNIALELIREPAVMFVDEPTSGLSSRDSENIMDLLKELALKGKLIFVVIHQPSSDIFKMFDKLTILDQGGYPIYNGNPIDAVIYFKSLAHHANAEESECYTCGNVNPEQIFNIIESKVVDEYGNLTDNRKVSPKEWNEHYEAYHEAHRSTIKDETEMPESGFKIPSKLKQVKVFFVRDVLSKLTNSQYMVITLFQAPALGLVLAFFMKYLTIAPNGESIYVFYESSNLPQYIFISVIVSLFIGLTTSAEEIIGNLKILKREKFLNLSKGSYLFSKISIMLIISAVQSLFYVVAGNWVLEIQGLNIYYWTILFSVSTFANILGLNISASFNSVKVIYILIPILIIPQLLFSGILVSFDKLNPIFAEKSHVPWVGNIMASRWAYEGLAVTQYKENKFEKNFYSYDKEMSFANWKKDQWLSNLQGKLDDAKRFIESTNNLDYKRPELTRKLFIVKNEIEKELRHVNITCDRVEGLCEAVNKINIDDFDEATYNSLVEYFGILKERYKKVYNHFESKKDSVQQKFTRPTEEFKSILEIKREAGEINGKEFKKMRKFFGKLKDNSFQTFRNKYKNKALEDFVTNANTLNFTDENNANVIQKTDPIYLDPYDYDYFKSHFYSPRKKIFGTYLDTFVSNVIVIWLMIFGLIFTLYIDALKKLLDGLGKFQLSAIFAKKK
jgi:ABC-type multidrug transport system ATPase subunit